MMSLSSFDQRIRNRSVLTHYFYEVKWNNGELTDEDMRTYAKEYYHLVRSIPGIVERVRDRALARGHDVSAIEENIAEETQHIELWERFAKSLNVSKQDLVEYEPHIKVRNAVCKLETLADGSLEDGIAAMYALELDLPAVAETKKDGLCKYYDLHSEDAHIYFDEHLAEEEHLQTWRAVPVTLSSRSAIDVSLDAQHEVLDGVCEACGIEAMCQ